MLILDVARFKYPPHWVRNVRASRLFRARALSSSAAVQQLVLGWRAGTVKPASWSTARVMTCCIHATCAAYQFGRWNDMI